MTVAKLHIPVHLYSNMRDLCVCLVVSVQCRKGWTERQASQAAAQVANLYGVLRRHWNNCKYYASELRFSNTQEFL